MKISIVTVCFNSEKTILDTLNSVANQTYNNIEHIIIDGGSTDQTLDIIKKHQRHPLHLVSESDHGIYDAMNKGISLVAGDIIGILNSDDMYYDNKTLEDIVEEFKNRRVEAVFGDLMYFKGFKYNKIVRLYKGNKFKPNLLSWGFIPPHPTLFLRSSVYKKYGIFNINFKIAGDFDFMARIFKNETLNYYYLPQVIIKMRTGGASAFGLKSAIILNREIYQSCNFNGIKTNYLKLISRYFIKIFEIII